MVKGERQRNVRGHALAPPSGVVSVARLVLYEKIGAGEHPCHWCGNEVRWKVGKTVGEPDSLLADHLDWDRENNVPSNLVPSCNACNAQRTQSGRGTLIGADEPVVLRSGRPTRAVERECEFCGSAFLTIPAEVKVGKGRFCGRSCARRAG